MVHERQLWLLWPELGAVFKAPVVPRKKADDGLACLSTKAFDPFKMVGDRNRNLIALCKRPLQALIMHLSAEQLEISARIDAKVQRLLGLGYDDLAIFVEIADDMPDFKRLLDAGQLLMDELCRRFAGFYAYAKILEQIAAGIASGEIQVPK